ncbi:MAG: hypothetical protein ACI8ZB_001811 [Desulforhopalus sp.]|jgi:hypothetical protein
MTIMTCELDQMKAQLSALEAEIAETEKRIPAHSIKPPVMEALFDLEDERERLLQKIKALQ